MGLQPIYQRGSFGRWWAAAGTCGLILSFICGCDDDEVQQAVLGGVQTLTTSMVASAFESLGTFAVLLVETLFTNLLLEGTEDIPTTVQAITETMVRLLA